MTKYRSKDTHSLEVKNYKKNISHVNGKIDRKKIDFKAKTVKRRRMTLYNDNCISPTGRYNNCKYT